MLHTNIPANKQFGFILNKTLQLNTVVPQSIFSLHTVTAEEPRGLHKNTLHVFLWKQY